MTFSGRIAYEARKSIDSAALTGTYQAIGTPLTNPSYILTLVNAGTTLVDISTDGTTDHDVLRIGETRVYKVGQVGMSGSLPAFPIGTRFFAKGTAGTGLIYTVSLYIVKG